MIIYDFLEKIDLLPYFIILFSCLLLLLYMNKRYGLQFIEPFNLADLAFFQSALVLIFYKNSEYVIVGIFSIFNYILLRIFFLMLLSKNKNYNIFFKINIIPLNLIFIINVFYIIISLYIFIKFNDSHSSGSFKLIWNQNNKLLGFLYAFLSITAILNTIYIYKYFRKYKYILLVFTILIYLYSGVYFHSRGSFILLLIIIIIYLKIENIKFNYKYFILFLSIMIFGILIGFGNNLLGFLNRVVKNTDGVFIILHEKLYNLDLFDHNFWVQIFKIISFKIGFEKQEIGEMLAYYSNYSYYLHGGPNDSLFTYLLLDFSPLNIYIYLSIILFVLTYIHKNLDILFKNYYIFNISAFFYIKSVGFIQGPSTAFLSLGRYLVFLVVIFIFYLILPKKIKKSFKEK